MLPNLWTNLVTEPIREGNGLKTMNEQYDYWDIIHQTDAEFKRIGWTIDDAKDYLDFAYGAKSRSQLNDQELLEFLSFLKNQPTGTSRFAIGVRKIQLPRFTKKSSTTDKRQIIPPF